LEEVVEVAEVMAEVADSVAAVLEEEDAVDSAEVLEVDEDEVVVDAAKSKQCQEPRQFPQFVPE
jgi:hypothetical protein